MVLFIQKICFYVNVITSKRDVSSIDSALSKSRCKALPRIEPSFCTSKPYTTLHRQTFQSKPNHSIDARRFEETAVQGCCGCGATLWWGATSGGSSRPLFTNSFLQNCKGRSRGVFRGAHGAMAPPLGRQNSILSRLVCKIAVWLPPL